MLKQLPLAISLESSAVFDNFFVSEPNQLLISDLKNFGTDTSPDHFVYLWGEQHGGLSYLLSAIQNNLSRLSMQYLPLRDLAAYPPSMILEGVDELQLVCIDDIDVVCGNDEWEEALFHLFNRLRDQGSYLVIASHISPRELPLNLPDLYSRLQWGITHHLKPLSELDKRAAIKMRAMQLGLELPDDVANFLLKRVKRSSSELFAMMATLDTASLANQRKLSIPFVKQVLSL